MNLFFTLNAWMMRSFFLRQSGFVYGNFTVQLIGNSLIGVGLSVLSEVV